MPVYKTYTVQSGDFISETLPIFRQFNTLGVESWFTPVIHPLLGTLVGYQITAPAIGSYSVTFTETAGEEGVIWRIVLNVVVDRYNVYSNCCGDRNLVWLNIQGGWQNYIFIGVKTFNVEVGSSKQFKTSEYVAKFSQINDVYTGEIISTGDIPKAHADALDGLRTSIQAYLLNDDTGLWDIPIKVDVGSFQKYKSRDKFYEVRVKFIYAEEVLIQTQ